MSTAAEPESDALRVAVLSDLHAYDTLGTKEKIAPSHLCTLNPIDQPGQHPIAGLKRLIEQEGLVASLLLCPGDLGDKARPAGITYGWQAVHDLAAALTAESVAATVGNHDVDSRFRTNDHDAKGHLQSLAPPFPFAQHELNDRFWSRHFVLIENTHYRLLVLNSSAFHGGNPKEIDHGRISTHTLTQLEATLSQSQIRPVNILLCHHHPHKHMEIGLGEFDEMLGGALLIQLLGSGRFGEWMIVHGHKHHPKLTYAAGGACSPIIFSAGSLCATLYPELGTRARNQFYILEFPPPRDEPRGLVGTFDAWDWSSGIGWKKARRFNSGLPGRGGFGFRGNLTLLSKRISDFIAGRATPWETIVDTFWELDYLLPNDLEALFATLREQFGLHLLTDTDDRPKQLGKQV